MSLRSATKITFDQDRPVVEAAQIAPLLELDVAGFQDLMRSGRIRSTVERGEGDDEGKFRLTFQSAQWRVRLTCGRDCRVLTLTRVRLDVPREELRPGTTGS
ncbi:DUF6522 family protein [Paracoccus benzoatiresistens]|uniref:DUF6522 family protein n=1 Tax=Paracoccus benzoatiresistens TaxID=2997341 RepID=A0ABT4JBE6_9RHOB|nr:DUF6522 family protein [Paracoccus sp. EF6]MCZ0964412.1 DUF6522 family protein [Paracoccus sp. EF6]